MLVPLGVKLRHLDVLPRFVQWSKERPHPVTGQGTSSEGLDFPSEVKQFGDSKILTIKTKEDLTKEFHYLSTCTPSKQHFLVDPKGLVLLDETTVVDVKGKHSPRTGERPVDEFIQLKWQPWSTLVYRVRTGLFRKIGRLSSLNESPPAHRVRFGQSRLLNNCEVNESFHWFW